MVPVMVMAPHLRQVEAVNLLVRGGVTAGSLD
jgi:hypothetical protein